MGNREALLAGAKRCLIEKGYARTTARDIAAASGVSLAAIGYHFGSKDALMNQAIYEFVGEWGDEVQRDAAGGLAELFLGIDAAQDPEAARTAGSVLHALFIGIIVKWFMDPNQALSARELTEGLRIISEHMTGPGHQDASDHT